MFFDGDGDSLALKDDSGPLSLDTSVEPQDELPMGNDAPSSTMFGSALDGDDDLLMRNEGLLPSPTASSTTAAGAGGPTKKKMTDGTANAKQDAGAATAGAGTAAASSAAASGAPSGGGGGGGGLFDIPVGAKENASQRAAFEKQAQKAAAGSASAGRPAALDDGGAAPADDRVIAGTGTWGHPPVPPRPADVPQVGDEEIGMQTQKEVRRMFKEANQFQYTISGDTDKVDSKTRYEDVRDPTNLEDLGKHTLAINDRELEEKSALQSVLPVDKIAAGAGAAGAVVANAAIKTGAFINQQAKAVRETESFQKVAASTSEAAAVVAKHTTDGYAAVKAKAGAAIESLKLAEGVENIKATAGQVGEYTAQGVEKARQKLAGLGDWLFTGAEGEGEEAGADGTAGDVAAEEAAAEKKKPRQVVGTNPFAADNNL